MKKPELHDLLYPAERLTILRLFHETRDHPLDFSTICQRANLPTHLVRKHLDYLVRVGILGKVTETMYRLKTESDHVEMLMEVLAVAPEMPAEELAEYFQPERAKILEFLMFSSGQGVDVDAIARAVGLPPHVVEEHLTFLRHLGIVKEKTVDNN